MGVEAYFICLTIVLFPDSPAPARERKSFLSQMDTHPNIPDPSMLHKRVWGSDSEGSGIRGFCQLGKSIWYQIEWETPLIWPQVITGWEKTLSTSNLKWYHHVASLPLIWWHTSDIKINGSGEKTDVVGNDNTKLRLFSIIKWIVHSPVC